MHAYRILKVLNSSSDHYESAEFLHNPSYIKYNSTLVYNTRTQKHRIKLWATGEFRDGVFDFVGDCLSAVAGYHVFKITHAHQISKR